MDGRVDFKTIAIKTFWLLGIVNTRKSLLRSAHDDILFAPPDGSSEWKKEYEWIDVIVYPDTKVALRSFHGKYLSDQQNGNMIWNKDWVRESELWDLETLRYS